MLKNRLLAWFGFVLATVIVTCSVASCNGSNAEEIPLKVVSLFFDAQILDAPDGMVILRLKPESAGVAGDGFLIGYDGKAYFLAEGQTDIRLSRDRRYRLHIQRLLLVNNERIIDTFGANDREVEINPGKAPRIPDPEGLKLPTFEGKYIYRWLSAPRPIVDFKTGGFRASTSIYQGPPVHVDMIEAEFRAFIRTGITPVRVMVPLLEGMAVTGSFQEPSGAAYTELRLRAHIHDRANLRTIVSEWSDMVEFER